MTYREKISEQYLNIIIVLILGIGFFLRYYQILHQSYWLDELCSVKESNPVNNLSFVIKNTLKTAPPLYNILLWCCYSLFGFNELVGRFLSVFFGSISLWFIYLLGKELFNKKVGIYALLISSLNEFLIYFSQEVRSYSLLFFLTIVSTLFFVKIIIKKNNKYVVFYIISIILTLYTHFYGFFILLFHFVVAVIFLKEIKLKYFLIAFCIILVSALPLLKTVFTLNEIHDFWIPKPKFYFMILYFNNYFRSKILSVIFLSLIALNFINYKQSNFRRIYNLLFIWIFISYSLPYVKSLISTPMLLEKYTIIVLPAIILLISSGIYSIKNETIRKVVLIIIVFFSSFHLINESFYFKHKKQQWRNVLFEVQKDNKYNLPVYDVVYDGEFYQIYSDLLGLKMNIHNKNKFLNDYKKEKRPFKFWMLDAHDNNIGMIKLKKDSKILKKIEYKNAQAIFVECK